MDALSNFANSVSQHYNHIANQNKADNAKAYRTWIESFAPEVIRKANKSRHTLTGLGVKGFVKRLQDDRQVKRAPAAHQFFMKDRYASGDMRGIRTAEALRQILKEWKDLGEADKQVSFSHVPQTSLLFVAPTDIDDDLEIQGYALGISGEIFSGVSESVRESRHECNPTYTSSSSGSLSIVIFFYLSRFVVQEGSQRM